MELLCYLHCISSRDTTVLFLATNMMFLFYIRSKMICFISAWTPLGYRGIVTIYAIWWNT